MPALFPFKIHYAEHYECRLILNILNLLLVECVSQNYLLVFHSDFFRLDFGSPSSTVAESDNILKLHYSVLFWFSPLGKRI